MFPEYRELITQLKDPLYGILRKASEAA